MVDEKSGFSQLNSSSDLSWRFEPVTLRTWSEHFTTGLPGRVLRTVVLCQLLRRRGGGGGLAADKIDKGSSNRTLIYPFPGRSIATVSTLNAGLYTLRFWKVIEHTRDTARSICVRSYYEFMQRCNDCIMIPFNFRAK